MDELEEEEEEEEELEEIALDEYTTERQVRRGGKSIYTIYIFAYVSLRISAATKKQNNNDKNVLIKKNSAAPILTPHS